MSIQTPSAYNPADRIKVWFNNLLFSTIPRRLSFSPDFTITEDATNNFFNIGLVAGGAGSTGTWDPNFAEALTHKTITDATNIFPSNFVKTNAVNTWTTAQNLPTSSQVNSSNIVTLIASQALTNKDLTGAGNTFPSSLATLTTSQALTNKNLTDATNTFPSKLVVNNANNNFGAFYQDIQQIAPPANPAANTLRLFMDNTYGILATLDSAGNKVLLGLFPTIQNTQDNTFGAHFEDITEIAKPASPASGTRRVYVDSTSHALSTVDSGGTSHNLEAAASTVAKGKATFSGTGSALTFTIAHGLGVNPSVVIMTPGSAASNLGACCSAEGATWWTTTDSTNITLHYGSGNAPASGSSNLTWYWIAYA